MTEKQTCQFISAFHYTSNFSLVIMNEHNESAHEAFLTERQAGQTNVK